jgi:two-component system chemotaxis sensor kinase CheA
VTVLIDVVDRLRHLMRSLPDSHDDDSVDVATMVEELQRMADSPPASAADDATAGDRASRDKPPAAQDGATTGAGESGAADPSDGSVRVAVNVLDRSMNLIGELVLSRNQIVQLLRTATDPNAQVQNVAQRLSLVTAELQEQVMKTRMQPMSRVVERIPQMVRDLSLSTGKHVVTNVEGSATELDRALGDAIRDPLMHMIRNAVDHGIEAPADREACGKPRTGTLSVRAAHEGGMVTIEVSDDGRGIDPRRMRESAVRKGLLTPAEAERLSDREAVELVFRPGFSTASAVTDFSGRGVGMDVVRTQVERAGGQVEIDSRVGRGTTVRLKVPLTLAIIPALLVRAAGQRFAVPQANLLELVHVPAERVATAVAHVRGAPIHRLRGTVLPLVGLGQMLRIDGRPVGAGGAGVHIVVVAVGTEKYGLVVDAIEDTEEIVIKPLSGPLKRLSTYAGATVLGDGSVALIVDVAGIAGRAGIACSGRAGIACSGRAWVACSGRTAAVAAPAAAVARTDGSERHVVVEIGRGVRAAVPLAIVARLEHVSVEQIERIGTSEVIQYRGAIVPVVRPE